MSRGRSAISLPKKPMRKIKKGMYPSILTNKNCKKNAKLSPSSSTIIEYSGLFPDEFWQFVDGELTFKNCARRKRTSIICTSNLSKHSVEYHEYGSQDSNNVETKVKPSRMHRETVPSTKRENPGLLESTSGGSGNSSSNPSSIAPEKKVHWNKERNPTRGQNFGLQFLDHRRAEDTPMILSSSSTCDSTAWWIQEEGCTHTLLTKRFLGGFIRIGEEVILPVLRRRLRKNSCMRTGCIASTAEDSKQNWKSVKCRQRIKPYSCDPKTFSGDNYSFEINELREVPPQKEVTHTAECVTQRKSDTQKGEYTYSLYRRRVHIFCCLMWTKEEINIPLQKLNWWQMVKNVKKKIIQSSPPTTMQTKQKQLQISRKVTHQIYWKYEQNAEYSEFYCPRRRNEFWQTVSTPSLRASLCWKNASWKLSIKVKTRIIRKTTCASNGPEVTLRNIWGRKGFDVWCKFLENRDQNCTRGTLTLNTSESRKWSNEEVQGREVHAKDSHKDNSLSEKAAKKIHEAGNCELRKTKFKQLIADVCMTFQRIQWRGIHSHGIWREVVQTLSHNWKYYFVMNRISDSKLHTKASSRIRKEHASGNGEELTHTSDDWWKAN